MVTGLDVLGATASALQVVGVICSLGNRILDKPKDAKAFQSICDDAETYIEHLKKWEMEFSGETRLVCSDLRQQLQFIIDDIYKLREKNLRFKVAMCLTLYKPEICEKFVEALEKFKCRMCAESKRSVDVMDTKLEGMTRAMEGLRFAAETMEKMTGLDDRATTINSEIKMMSHEIHEMSKAIASVESILRTLDAGNTVIPQLDRLILADGKATREQIQDVVYRLDKVDEKLGLNESVMRIRGEIMCRSSDLLWYESQTKNANLNFGCWMRQTPIQE